MNPLSGVTATKPLPAKCTAWERWQRSNGSDALMHRARRGWLTKSANGSMAFQGRTAKAVDLNPGLDLRDLTGAGLLMEGLGPPWMG